MSSDPPTRPAMKVVGFCGYSGSGKTTLVEQMVGGLRARGLRVSVVKHAHHGFDIDQPGKDSWRHREAGAYEVVVSSSRRLAKVRSLDGEREPTAHELLAELGPCDWALVEGFKHADLPKIEVWRASTGRPVQYPADPHIRAIATDSRAALPQPTELPLLDLNDPEAVIAFLIGQATHFHYTPRALPRLGF